MPKLKPGTIWPKPAKVELTQEQIDNIADTDMTFSQVEEKYGEENAILVGIARDPDNPEWTDEDWARRSPSPRPRPGQEDPHDRTRLHPPGRPPRPSPRKSRPQLEDPRQRHTPKGPHQFVITSALKTAKIVHNCRIHYLLDSSVWRIACCQNRIFKIRN